LRQTHCLGACAVPFEEDDRNPKIWFLDHSYLEQMYRMFKKGNGAPRRPPRLLAHAVHQVLSCKGGPPCAARERVVGWYSTGPRLREADLDINDLVANYCDVPLLVICEVQARAGHGLHQHLPYLVHARLCAPGAALLTSASAAAAKGDGAADNRLLCKRRDP